MNLQYQIEQKVNKIDKATTAEATAGINDTKWMTPLKVKEAIEGKSGQYLAPDNTLYHAHIRDMLTWTEQHVVYGPTNLLNTLTFDIGDVFIMPYIDGYTIKGYVIEKNLSSSYTLTLVTATSTIDFDSMTQANRLLNVDPYVKNAFTLHTTNHGIYYFVINTTTKTLETNVNFNLKASNATYAFNEAYLAITAQQSVSGTNHVYTVMIYTRSTKTTKNVTININSSEYSVPIYITGNLIYIYDIPDDGGYSSTLTYIEINCNTSGVATGTVTLSNSVSLLSGISYYHIDNNSGLMFVTKSSSGNHIIYMEGRTLKAQLKVNNPTVALTAVNTFLDYDRLGLITYDGTRYKLNANKTAITKSVIQITPGKLKIDNVILGYGYYNISNNLLISGDLLKLSMIDNGILFMNAQSYYNSLSNIIITPREFAQSNYLYFRIVSYIHNNSLGRDTASKCMIVKIPFKSSYQILYT